MGNEVLSAFAEQYPYCAVCWSRLSLHVHHIVGGPGRKHVRENLLRLCFLCHDSLHSGGGNGVTREQCLTAKRETDSAHYDPTALAQLRHRFHLGYGPEPYSPRTMYFRRRNGIPEELLMTINSRRKGKAGELEAAAELNRLLPHAHARRSQQHSGTESASDLIAPGLPGLWLEVKRVQALNLQKTFEKSLEQCGDLAPVVLHRKNGTDWLVTFRLEDLHAFVRQVSEAS